ncbi:hypothetical protein AXG93_4698s1360 [Marchantia polymorpha subsp. ruderalis]|uniref:Uncharacterized protein n=1 Tax=Marchantia polymorpha subsp. ruderalis TaxID=1480154 RepID=A0A176VKL1_MARPO|nr:hypothetical protein AXG93_4698s1360 [Marchantia polymorpha subsp. ruderalis]
MIWSLDQVTRSQLYLYSTTSMSSMQSAKDATKDTTEQTKNYGVVKAGHGQEGHTTKDKASEGKHNTVSALNQAGGKADVGAKETATGKN